MNRRPIRRIVLATLWLALCGAGLPQTTSEQSLIAAVDSGLTKLLFMHKTVRTLHPYLEPLHPIAIAEKDSLFIFDFDSSQASYRFVTKVPVPFPMPSKIRAAFPLSGYHGKPSCVVTRDVFDSPVGYALLFHEFVHCSQAATVEYALKNRLKVAQIAAQNHDYSWEITHPFPYQDSIFVRYYARFLQALARGDHVAVAQYRTRLRQHLSQVDFEYMVWQEWKEGFARLLENQIRSQAGLSRNESGKNTPFDRVTFYYGGAMFIDLLVEGEAALFQNADSLFSRMMSFPGGE